MWYVSVVCCRQLRTHHRRVRVTREQGPEVLLRAPVEHLLVEHPLRILQLVLIQLHRQALHVGDATARKKNDSTERAGLKTTTT